MASVSSEFLSVDPYLKNAFSSAAVNFDISHKHDDGEGQQNYVDLMSVHKAPAQEWEVDVRQQMSSQKWLQNHGLRKLRLQMTQILDIIGFKLCDDYDPSLKRPVSSRYGQGLFEQITAEDGKTFNIACDRDKLLQLRRRLMQATALYRRRLEWLTSESRRVFGVVEEKAVTVVMDVRNMSPEQFDQYRAALDRVMREQFHHVTKFNLIRAAEDLQLYSAECIPCSHGTVEAAIQWMWALDRLAPVSNTACAEAVLTALLDRHNEAVYLFTEGTSIDCGRELVLEKVRNVERKIPVHVVSFNCNSSDTIKFLRNFATVTGGRFHAYAVLMETDAYDPSPTTADPFASKANVLLKRKTFGGVAPGAGVRPDVVLLFEEMEEARTNLQQLEILIDRTPEPSKALTVAEKVKAEKTAAEEKDEQYMSSKQWLSVYGINARKLSLQDVLASVAFRHQDGVVEVLEKPTNDQTDAVGQEKLINARYCEKFPVVRWKDDRVVHVQVTPEVHRTYEQRMHVVLKAIQQRIDWLKQGSRALFGTVVEEEIYILIDTSASMQHSIQFVKERLLVLMQEQLRHKAKFNLIAFNSKVSGWRDHLMEVSEKSLQSAWKWVQGLSCWGSTNTYAALQAALSDTNTQAIYLLTDGRPDQMAKSILTQVRMQNRVPIHTISFNCEDNDANQFLYDLAQITEGRYHCYTPHGTSGPQPDTWQSEDIKLLEDELGRGLEYLDQMAELRDQCASMAWKTEIDALKTCSKGHSASDTPSRVSAAPPLDARDLFRPSSAPLQSPHPARGRPSSAGGFRPSRPQGAPKRPQSAKSHRGRKLVAGRSAPGSLSHHGRGHTRTSLMRTLNSSGRFTPSEWLLPETAQLFEQQTDRQRQLAELLASLGLAPSIKPTEKDVSEQTTKHRKRRHKLAKAHASSSKQWLKKHGLVARRLTILDALAPTLVPHRSTYVPVLDKRVMARVFDEIMPIAHVSGRQRSKVTLVNPNAVNLIEYEERLEKAIARYRRRLNSLVWNALPESVKEEFESKEPASFEENRTKFLQALEEVEWPNAQADIKALEKEIAKGHKFLQQSKDLRQAAKEGDAEAASEAASVAVAAASVRETVDEGDEEEEEEVEEEEAASESVDRVLYVRDDEILTAPTTPHTGVDAPTPHPPGTPSPRSQDAQTPRSPSNLTPRSQNTHTPRPPDTATPRSAGSYTPRKVVTAKEQRGRGVIAKSGRSGRKDLKTSNKDEVGRKSAGRGGVMVSMLRGTKVIARKHVDGLYYPGKVVKCPSVRRAIVEFTDGQCDVLTRFILPVGGAVACPPLSVGDYALVQVMNMSLATECYVPCIVQFTPQRRQTQMQFYTVMLYNGQKVTTRRSHLVKISKERFELSARYITEVQGEDRDRVEANVYISERRRTEEDELRRNRDHQQDSSRSRSRSRSSSPPSRPRSPTPGGGHRSHPSNSRHHREMKIVGKHDEERYKSSKRSIKTRSRSRSESESPSRQDSLYQKASARSRSPSHSRSRSRSPSLSPDRDSTLKKEVKKKTRSGSRSRSGSSRSSVDVVREEDMERRSRSRSGSDSRSESPVTDRQRELKRLKKQLKKQRQKQAKERKRLKRKMKEMSNMQTQLLKRILDEHKEEEEQKKAEEEAQEPEEEEVPIVTPRMMRLRRALPELKPAEEVLARFSDDGWYYRGTVQQNLGDLSYIVEDATGYIERIWREDIISDYDDNAPPLKENDRVVAQHPQHSGSYAPGSVLSFDDVLQMVTIQFYDGQEGAVPRAEVYRLPLEKYNHDVLHIQQCQRSMLGLSVVARDDDSGEYFPGQIVDVKEGGQGYVIRWSDGSQAEQLPVHIFSAVTRRPRLLIGDRVLAVANPEQVVFLPGQIIGAQERSMVVRFCDGQVRDDVIPLFSYWLSTGYCEEASYFWKLHQPHFGKRQMYHA